MTGVRVRAGVVLPNGWGGSRSREALGFGFSSDDKCTPGPLRPPGELQGPAEYPDQRSREGKENPLCTRPLQSHQIQAEAPNGLPAHLESQGHRTETATRICPPNVHLRPRPTVPWGAGTTRARAASVQGSRHREAGAAGSLR